MKTAVVYDWLTTVGGGEKTLEAILEAFPSPIHTLLYNPAAFKGLFSIEQSIQTSFIQNLPFSSRLYRNYFPLFPLGVEQFNLSAYDVVLSVSHAVAKGALTTSSQLHLCYCFTPIRYAWDLTHDYLQGTRGIQKLLAQFFLHKIRNWDITSLGRVDHFATLSHYIAKRIKKVYGRESTVIYPPVDVEKIPFCSKKEEFYLTVSRMVPYKRIDLIVEAFSHFPNKRLIVVGDGPEMKKIRAKSSKNVELLGWQSDEIIHALMGRAKGFLFAAEEDFGIVVVEAQAAGTPVIALGKGAALETVIANQTGIFFPEQTRASLCQAIEEFEKKDFDPTAIAEHAKQFGRARFIKEFTEFVTEKYQAFHEIHHSSRR